MGRICRLFPVTFALLGEGKENPALVMRECGGERGGKTGLTIMSNADERQWGLCAALT